MRIVLLLSLFVLWQVCTPDLGGLNLTSGAGGPWLFLAGYSALVGMVAFVGRRWVGRLDGAGPVARPIAFERILNLARYVVPVWFAVGLISLGWRTAVDRLVGTTLMSPGTLLGVLPGMIAWVGLWWAAYPVDRAVRELNVVYDIDAGLPVYAFPSLVQFLSNRLRAQILFTTVPVVLVMMVRDGVAVLWTHLLRRPDWTQTAESVVSTGAVLVVVLLSPVVLRFVLQTSPLPESPLRDRLRAIGELARVRCRDVLLWNTHFNTGNAAVMGLARPVRFVMLSDLLVGSMTDLQIEAVFAHELGHVRHRHLAWFVAFMLGVGGAVFTGFDRLEQSLAPTGYLKAAYDLASTAGSLAIVLSGFGFLSRWFERQADVFAARTVGGDSVERGATIFASALSRVAVVNNISPSAPNWTHGSITERISYVLRLARDPVEAARFSHHSRAVTIALAVVTVVGSAVAVGCTFW